MAFTEDEQQIVNNMDSRITKIENLILDLQDSINYLRNITTNSGVVGLTEDMEDVNQQVSSLNEIVNDFNVEVSQNTEQVNNLNNEVNRLDDDTIVIQSHVDENEEDIQTLEERMAVYENQFDNIGDFSEVPDPPSNLGLKEYADYVEISFDMPDMTAVDEYEIWSSVGSNDDYKLREIVPVEDISFGQSRLVVVDKSYNAVTDIHYKIYAVNRGARSAGLAGSIALNNKVHNPLDVRLDSDVNVFDLNYNVPDDRRLAYVEVYLDIKESNSDLSRDTAERIYKGLADHVSYHVKAGDENKYHKFWVESVTRT